ncbi:MAG: hypothetical protein KDK34_23665, partial [Leptospiraceae bacterium]|nr:hypothetical protein [Leptospiraceae bacterium]
MIESRSEMQTANAGGVSPVLSVRDLSIGFQGEEGMVGITDRVSFELRPGEILGIAGESGSG